MNLIMFSSDQQSGKRGKILAQKRGILIFIPGSEVKKLKTDELNALKNTTTITLSKFNPFDQTRTKMDFGLLFRSPFENDKEGIVFPHGCFEEIQMAVPRIELLKEEKLRVPFLLQPTKIMPVHYNRIAETMVMDDHQMRIIQQIKNNPEGGIISSAMGSGKAAIACAIIYGFYSLRPAVVAGKGIQDTKQLYQWITAFGEKNPQWKQNVILLCGSKKSSKIVKDEESIIVCTHSGLHNIPEETKLLVLDEAHAAATPKKLITILSKTKIEKTYALSATIGMRPDGGDKLLKALCGKVIAKATHKDFETLNRVVPTKLSIYPFLGKDYYAAVPFDNKSLPKEHINPQTTWVENHPGRHRFCADLCLWLPYSETKVLFVPHILHAAKIREAILTLIKEKNIKLKEEELPVLIHSKIILDSQIDTCAKISHQIKKEILLPKSVQQKRIELLRKGILKLVIATDSLSTGFDTPEIQHIIDASGQKATIATIQRTGRGTRPTKNGERKTNNIHIILDKTQPFLNIIGEQKIKTLIKYYSLPSNAIKTYHTLPWKFPTQEKEIVKTLS